MKIRRSTALLIVAWLATFALYLQVRPAPGPRSTYDPATTATVPLPVATVPPSTAPPPSESTTTSTSVVDGTTTTTEATDPPEGSTTTTGGPGGSSSTTTTGS